MLYKVFDYLNAVLPSQIIWKDVSIIGRGGEVHQIRNVPAQTTPTQQKIRQKHNCHKLVIRFFIIIEI